MKINKIMAMTMVCLMLTIVINVINVGAATIDARHLAIEKADSVGFEEKQVEPQTKIIYKEISQRRVGIFVKTQVRFEVINLQGNGIVIWDFGDNDKGTMLQGGGPVQNCTYWTLLLHFKKTVRVTLRNYDCSPNPKLYCTFST